MIDLLITIDVDADYFDSSFNPHNVDQPTWNSVHYAVPQIADLLCKYKGSDGRPCVATWFVRADDQIGYYYNSNAYLFEAFDSTWKEFLSVNHEIGWHPHLYKHVEEKWEHQTEASALKHQLFQSYSAIKELGWHIKSSRIGEAFFSNEVGEYLTCLGITRDSSCLPGRKRMDSDRLLDWSISPQHPYYPSVNDYRIPGIPALPLSEIPFSMIEVMADYDTTPIMRYLDLSFWHQCIKKGLNEICKTSNLINMIIHPSSIMPGIAHQRHGLLSFSIEEVSKNIDYILAKLNESNKPYRFCTISQIQLK